MEMAGWNFVISQYTYFPLMKGWTDISVFLFNFCRMWSQLWQALAIRDQNNNSIDIDFYFYFNHHEYIIICSPIDWHFILSLCMDYLKKLTEPQITRRSFLFYDKQGTQALGKKEIFKTLFALGKVEAIFEKEGIWRILNVIRY